MTPREAAQKTIGTVTDRLALQRSYQKVFDPTNPDSQAVLRHLMKVGFVTSSTFVKGDPHETALNEGSRRLVLSILRFTHRDMNKLTQEITTEYENT